MREQLISYVDLLFAGASNASDIKQEILQNTLDRYDDLLAQGKSPQAAYSLAISGIGDISEILNSSGEYSDHSTDYNPIQSDETPASTKPVWKTALQAIGICLYIMCPIPLFVLQNEVGLCGLLTFVAVATALMVISATKKNKSEEQKDEGKSLTPQEELHKAIKTIITVIGLCCYFAVSFSTGAWYITWLIFPIIGAVQGLVKACMDLREAE